MYHMDVREIRSRASGLLVSVAIGAVAADAVACSTTEHKAVSQSETIAFSERIIDKYDAYRILLVSTDGRRRTVLPVAPRHSGQPTWSPDATKIAFVNSNFSGSDPEVWLMNSNGSAQRRLTRHGDEPAWSPSGGRIAFSRAGDIYVMSTDGHKQRRLTRNGTAPTWSPDGGKIAFARAAAPRCYRRNLDRPRCQNSYEIYVMGADGTDQQRLTRNRVAEYDPDWSPTGAKIAYESARTPKSESYVFVMNADGSNQHRLPSGPEAHEPSWSADATKIVYTSHYVRLFTINADGSGKRQLYPTRGFICTACGSPAWSRG